MSRGSGSESFLGHQIRIRIEASWIGIRIRPKMEPRRLIPGAMVTHNGAGEPNR
jgi:hypothetical protein